MIEEIKRKLKGNRVFLKCINKEGFISKNEINKEILNLEEIEVQYYLEEDSDFFGGLQLIASESFLEDKGLVIGDMFISNNEIEYFEIIESPYIKDNPTFNDLIDVAMKAWKDGYLKVLEFERGVVEQIFTVIGDDAYRWHHGDSEYKDAVSLVKSLYTETFVIENDIDILKLKGEPKITLSNGNEFVATDMQISSNSRGMHAICFIDIDNYEMVYSFFELKGATVTQKRGK